MMVYFVYTMLWPKTTGIRMLLLMLPCLQHEALQARCLGSHSYTLDADVSSGVMDNHLY